MWTGLDVTTGGSCLSPCSMATCPMLQKDSLFPLGSHAYRIPALLFLPKCRTLLAFAEKRKSKSDEQADTIVMRQGQLDTSGHVQVWQAQLGCPVRQQNWGPSHPQWPKIPES